MSGILAESRRRASEDDDSEGPDPDLSLALKLCEWLAFAMCSHGNGVRLRTITSLIVDPIFLQVRQIPRFDRPRKTCTDAPSRPFQVNERFGLP